MFQSNRDYSIHQPKGDAAAGNHKIGYLNKRSEGRIRNTWQKRRCQVQDGFLKVSTICVFTQQNMPLCKGNHTFQHHLQ